MKTLFGILKCAKLALAVVLLAGAAGCTGYVAGGSYDVSGAVVAPAPGAYFYGGFYGHPHDVHAFSHRGFVSRGYRR
jgi:hypothetical protein